MKSIDLPGIRRVNSGKVREMFEVDGKILMVATDRISAFDVVLPDTIPNKGKILTQISEFWFGRTRHIIDNHLITGDVDQYPSQLKPYAESLRGRSMLVRKCAPLPIECVVRGYLAGSGWKDYRESGMVCGIPLPPGLQNADRLPEPIFTPATKATSGHDENISFETAVEMVGVEVAEKARDVSIRLYSEARDYASTRGIIICDTKFEFGFDGDQLILIDEALTPDSSRFWPSDRYQPGSSPPSFDKQFIRDYLETLDWDKQAPGPSLPDTIIRATAELYVKAYHELTGWEPQL